MRLIIFNGSKENHKHSQRNSFTNWPYWLHKLVEALSNIDQSKEYAQNYSILSFCLIFKLYNSKQKKKDFSGLKKEREIEKKREKKNAEESTKGLWSRYKINTREIKW